MPIFAVFPNLLFCFKKKKNKGERYRAQLFYLCMEFNTVETRDREERKD